MVMLGTPEDNAQEDISQETTDLVLNKDLAVVLYSSVVNSINQTNETLDFLKKLKRQPKEEWPEQLTLEDLNEQINLGAFTYEKLSYLKRELTEAVEYLVPADEDENRIFTPRNTKGD